MLTQRVPKLACAAVPAVFESLVSSIPELIDQNKIKARDFDWALHPGGATILSGVEKAMHIPSELLRASYEIYISHGNSSSATIFSVLDRLLSSGPCAEHVVGCAFGPGIAVEMMIFKDARSSSSGTSSPGETLVAEDVD